MTTTIDWNDIRRFALAVLRKRCRLCQWELPYDDQQDIVSDSIVRALEKGVSDNPKRVVAGTLRDSIRSYWESRVSREDRIDRPVLEDDPAEPTPDPWVDYSDGLAWLALARLTPKQSETTERILERPDWGSAEHQAELGLTKQTWHARIKSLRSRALPAYVHSVLADCVDRARDF